MKSESDIDGTNITLPTNGRAASTPYYVLMDGDQRLGPNVVLSDSEPECVTMYGFSDKKAYDRFSHDGKPDVKPYPLVKGYLRKLIDSAGDRLQLVVVNAASSCDIVLQAATMKAVLQAHENRTANVVAAYRLTFDPAVTAYQIERPDV